MLSRESKDVVSLVRIASAQRANAGTWKPREASEDSKICDDGKGQVLVLRPRTSAQTTQSMPKRRRDRARAQHE
jgi:hypothetical protein